MKYEQGFEIANQAFDELIGAETIETKNLSTFIDKGKEIINSNQVDAYLKMFVDRIMLTEWETKEFDLPVPDVFKTSSEFAAIMRRIKAFVPKALRSEVYELENGDSIDQYVVRKPEIRIQFFGDTRSTIKDYITLERRQVRSGLTDEGEWNALQALIIDAIEAFLRIYAYNIVMELFESAIADTVYAEFPSGGYGNASGIRAVNVLYRYNHEVVPAGGTKLKAANALSNKEFFRFFATILGQYQTRMTTGMPTLYNINGMPTGCKKSNLKWVGHADVASAIGPYLYNTDFGGKGWVGLPEGVAVPCWQGLDKENVDSTSFEATSAIDVVSANSHTVSMSGILGCLYDKDAIGICHQDAYSDIAHNADGQYDNLYFFEDYGRFQDSDKDFVVFFIADETENEG